MILIFKWVVISFQCAHQIKGGDSLFCVIRDSVCHLIKGSSLDEFVCVVVNLRILHVNLNLVEGVITHSSRVNNKSTLRKTSNFIFYGCIKGVLFIIMNGGVLWLGFANYL